MSKTNFFWTFDHLSFIVVWSFILVLVFFFFFFCWVWLLRKRRIVNDTWISSPIGFPIFWDLSKIKYILPLVCGLRIEFFDPVWVTLAFLFLVSFGLPKLSEINKILAPFFSAARQEIYVWLIDSIRYRFECFNNWITCYWSLLPQTQFWELLLSLGIFFSYFLLQLLSFRFS